MACAMHRSSSEPRSDPSCACLVRWAAANVEQLQHPRHPSCVHSDPCQLCAFSSIVWSSVPAGDLHQRQLSPCMCFADSIAGLSGPFCNKGLKDTNDKPPLYCEGWRARLHGSHVSNVKHRVNGECKHGLLSAIQSASTIQCLLTLDPQNCSCGAAQDGGI